AVVAHACAAEANFALAEMERLNAEALAALIERHNVQLKSFPRDVVDAARKVSAEVLGELAARGEMTRKVHDSYAAFRDRTAPWSRVSIKVVLDKRLPRSRRVGVCYAAWRRRWRPRIESTQVTMSPTCQE